MLYDDLNLPEAGSRVVVGMSGGVDSTLAAVLLKERGCKVTGVTMSSWKGDLPLTASAEGMRNSCYGPDERIDIEECGRFCAANDIEYLVIDVRDAYQKEVLDYFRSEYRSGRTPNPCIRCNPYVKFGALLEGARKAGANFDYFCTGHYARLVRHRGVPGAPVHIAMAKDRTKDQSYFLYRIPSDVLEKVRFPLGGMYKKEVFALARERGLVAASRGESQDFIPPEYLDIVFSDNPPVSGDIVDTDGRVVGRHRGIVYYTIGQRRGLGISSPRPLYVKAIDADKNRIIVAETDELENSALIACDWVWPGGLAPAERFRGMVKIRLASPPAEATIEPCEDDTCAAERPLECLPFKEKPCGTYRVAFDSPQRAVAPGQSAVIYQDEVIIGGGIISRGIEHE